MVNSPDGLCGSDSSAVTTDEQVKCAVVPMPYSGQSALLSAISQHSRHTIARDRPVDVIVIREPGRTRKVKRCSGVGYPSPNQPCSGKLLTEMPMINVLMMLLLLVVSVGGTAVVQRRSNNR
ncbi:hypothetical protein RHA1_ro03126 [Rhodococcus jostii RHA1]|uniref:Uncharacterized protein n=1 Tax=Rhodococcus jostii (strain RHA1) TaxID=101510 RepID=Q0SC07_RHOJR|nr:hypothetical protein RHA1_ro03126 [Rhodococcus jostii RHA1]